MEMVLKGVFLGDTSSFFSFTGILYPGQCFQMKISVLNQKTTIVAVFCINSLKDGDYIS